MTTKFNIKQSLKAGLFAALTAAIINAVLFMIFHASGIITDSIFVQPNQPLSIIPVLFSSIFPTLIASLVFFLFEKFTKNGFNIFRVVAIILLLLSFSNPFMMIKGVTLGYALALNFMHIIVLAALFFWIIKIKNTQIQQ